MAVKESYAGKINRKLNKKLHVIDVAAGRVPADLVLKNAAYVNVFSNELCRGDIAVAEGLIVGMGEYHGKVEADVGGKIVLPGFIDAHIHLESSLVSPKEFAKAVLPHGTTTVITDPHEIANVRWHRVYAPGHRGPAGGRAVHAALLRSGHAPGRVRSQSGLSGHRLLL